MRRRQEKIIEELLKLKKPLSIKMLAEEFNCSERTIQNDLKTIEKWLKVNSQEKVHLERQPGVGTYLEASDQMRKQLLNLIKEYQSESQLKVEKRQNKILLHLLMSHQNRTIDELAEKFYESKEKIREDLQEVKKIVQYYQLTLVIKPRIGIQIKGKERNKRNLLAQVIKKGKKDGKEEIYLQEFFEKKDINKVNQIVKAINPNLLDHDEDYQISSIVIHILFMIERIKNESTLQIKVEEWSLIDGTLAYEKSIQIAEKLAEAFTFAFPKDEVAYLALHVASLQMDRRISHKDSKKKIESPVGELVELLIKDVNRILAVDLSKDKILKRNLQSHLESAYLRIMSEFYISNPLLAEIKASYTHLFITIQMILEDYSDREGISFPEEEIAYLTVHFKAALERIKDERNYKIVITCDYGIGVSSFIEAKIQHAFPQVEVLELLSHKELKEYEPIGVLDFIISTKSLSGLETSQIVVSPLMNQQDLDKIQSYLVRKEKVKEKLPFDFQSYTNTFLIEPQVDLSTKEACLSFICEKMEKKDYISPLYKNSVFEREESSSTQIADLVAIPHGDPNYVKKSGIFILSLKKPIKWGEGKVQLVLFLALHKEDLGLKETKQIFSSLYKLTENKKRLNHLLAQKTQLGVLKILSEDSSYKFNK